MADISGKVTANFGEVVGVGPFGEKGSVNVNVLTGQPEMSFQAVAFDLSVKVTFSDVDGLKISVGQGNIFGLVAGVSEFAGIQVFPPTFAPNGSLSVTSPAGGIGVKGAINPSEGPNVPPQEGQQFNPETGEPLTFSDGSPVLGPVQGSTNNTAASIAENIDREDAELGAAMQAAEIGANIDREDADLGAAMRENEISANIDREDADLGAAMRENEISANIDREDAALGAAMRENEISANIDREDADLGAAMQNLNNANTPQDNNDNNNNNDFNDFGPSPAEQPLDQQGSIAGDSTASSAFLMSTESGLMS